MSDPPPAPKPKPGSLRDRIAAFENKGGSSPSAAPPAPRPKPGGLSWKPKPVSPPASPGRPASPGAAEGAGVLAKPGGMSAADAKESIGRGVSLKERMAALQGKGGFGAPVAAAPAPPRPAGDKPKWKPPPRVASPPVAEADEHKEPSRAISPAGDGKTPTSPPADQTTQPLQSPPLPQDPPKAEEPTPAEGEPTEDDPQEEERKRRAAIAARMARLGGARVGMAPPIFGKKPEVKRRDSAQEEAKAAAPPPKVETPKEEKEILLKSPPAISQAEDVKLPSDTEAKEQTPVPSIEEPVVTGAPLSEPTAPSHTEVPSAPSSLSHKSSSSVLSPDAAESPRVPAAMPVPAVPRRAGPPRKKGSAKSPSPAPTPPIGGLDKELTSEQAPSDDAVAPAAEANVSHEDETPAAVQDEPHPVPEAAAQHEEPPAVHEEHQTEAEGALTEDTPANEKGSPHTPSADGAAATSTHSLPDEATEDLHKAASKAKLPDSEEKQVEDIFYEAVEEVPASPPVAAAAATSLVPKSPELAATASPTALVKDASTSPVLPSLPPPVTALSPVASPTAAISPKASVEPDSEPTAPAEEEEDEAARRKRIAERMAKMGGLNPFGAPTRPPERKTSTGSGLEVGARPITESKSTGILGAEAKSPATPFTDVERASPKLVAGQDEGALKEMRKRDEEVEEDLEHDLKDRDGADVHLSPELTAESTADIEVEDGKLDHQDVHAIDEPSLTEDAKESTQALTSSSLQPTRFEPSQRAEYDAPLPPQRRSIPPAPRRLQPTSEQDDPNTELVAPAPPPIPANRPSPNLPIEAKLADPEEEPAPPSIPADRLTSKPPFIHQKSTGVPEEEEEVSKPQALPAGRHNERSVSLASQAEEQSPLIERNVEDFAMPPPLPSGRPSIPPPIPSGRPTIPLHVPATATMTSDSEEEEAAPPPPPRMPPPMMNIPKAEDDEDAEHDDIGPLHETPTMITSEARRSLMDIPLVSSRPPASEHSELRNLGTEGHIDHELMDESEGDPIDPRFHSPNRLSAMVSPPIPQEPVPAEPEAQDVEQARRRTIAERMAKLGGIKFGAPPPVSKPMSPRSPQEDPRSPRDLPSAAEEPLMSLSNELTAPDSALAPDTQVEEEADEQARRERIRAKLAGMGGMRFGMFPPSAPATAPPPPPARVASSEGHPGAFASPPPVPPGRPNKQVPPPPSEAAASTSDDESLEIDPEAELGDAELEEEGEEEAPPPLPSRVDRSMSSSSTAAPQRRGSQHTPTALDTPVTARPPLTTMNSEFVMVTEPEESEPENIEAEDIPPPPPRPSHPHPSRAAPTVPHPPALDTSGNQWQLPAIPTGNLNLGNSADLASSTWSEDSTTYPPAPPSKSSLDREDPTPLPSAVEKPMSADDLIAVWGRVGVMLVSVASELQQKSQKSIVGDGSYAGFVTAVLAEVPNAMTPVGTPPSYGHLIYAQVGAAVQRRASEIMPGDIVALYDAKLKGHKGIQTYNQHVGAQEPCVGVVSEFEPKKSKVRVLQANQHVGHQAVESVSYRLEDLKSGTVKIFRVLEA